MCGYIACLMREKGARIISCFVPLEFFCLFITLKKLRELVKHRKLSFLYILLMMLVHFLKVLKCNSGHILQVAPLMFKV